MRLRYPVFFNLWSSSVHFRYCLVYDQAAGQIGMFHIFIILQPAYLKLIFFTSLIMIVIPSKLGLMLLVSMKIDIQGTSSSSPATLVSSCSIWLIVDALSISWMVRWIVEFIDLRNLCCDICKLVHELSDHLNYIQRAASILSQLVFTFPK
ncbi:unnamed protein product, partial [Vitis vinifera]